MLEDGSCFGCGDNPKKEMEPLEIGQRFELQPIVRKQVITHKVYSVVNLNSRDHKMGSNKLSPP
jgi:hypothetical protein